MIGRPTVALALSILAIAGSSHADQPTGEPTCAVRYVANAGVLVESGSRRFLIDAPIREGIPPYAVPTDAQRQALEAAEPPFDNVDAILITHWHEDHFSAEAVAARLRSSAKTLLISSKEIVDRVRRADPALPEPRFVALTPAPGESLRTMAAGVPVHVLRIRHNPARRLPEQHVGFLIEGCQTLLHTGDADPVADNFGVLASLPPVQVGVLPFWYVLDERSREMVRSSIRPARVLGIHVPPADVADVSQTLASLPDVTLLTRPDQRVNLGVGRSRLAGCSKTRDDNPQLPNPNSQSIWLAGPHCAEACRPPAPRPTRGKTRLRRWSHDDRSGSGDSNAGAQSVGRPGHPGASGESAPPRTCAPPARFSS